MSLLFVAEAVLYHICLLAVAVRIFHGEPKRLRTALSFSVYIPYIALALIYDYSVFSYFFALLIVALPFIVRSTVKKVRLSSVIYFFVVFYSLNSLLIYSIVSFLPYSTDLQLAVEAICNSVTALACIILCKSRFAPRAAKTVGLIPKPVKLLILALLIINSLMAAAINLAPADRSGVELLMFIKKIFVVLLFLISCTFPALIVYSVTGTELRKLTEDYEEQIKAQAEHYLAMSRANFELRRFRHDLKNLKIGVCELIGKGDYTEALGLLEKTDTAVYGLAAGLFYDTGNGVVDALLSEKQEKATTSNIKIEFSGAVPDRNISATELCVIFGNTLDNAIEACNRIEDENERIIRIMCRYTENFMFLKMTNPVKNTVRAANGLPGTTKEDKELHGFGLYSLDKVIKNHNGELKLSCENNIFNLNLSLCLD